MLMLLIFTALALFSILRSHSLTVEMFNLTFRRMLTLQTFVIIWEIQGCGFVDKLLAQVLTLRM